MTDEITPPRIDLPYQVKQVSREGRQEDKRRFHQQIAKLSEEEGRKKPPASLPHRSSGATDLGGADKEDRDEDSALGRNLDLST